MKKIIVYTSLLLTSFSLSARTQKTITVDGNERTYTFYYPTGRPASEETQLVVGLHGLGQTVDDFIGENQAQSLCDEHGMALLLPQALPEQNKEVQSAAAFMNTDYPGLSEGLSAAWGAGLSVRLSDIDLGTYAGFVQYLLPGIYAAGKMELNADIDDIHFINEAIADCGTGYHFKDDVYMVGGSLGGAMTYRYAFSNASQAAKIAVISGFVGKEVEIPASIDMPIMVVHSQTDELVAYEGTVFSRPIEEYVNTFVAANPHNAPQTRTIGSVDSTTSVYDYAEEPRVLFYQVSAAKHNMSDLKHMDLYEEVWNFFASPLSSISEAVAEAVSLEISPNPAGQFIRCNMEGFYAVYDLTGRLMMRGETSDGTINVGRLAHGRYLFRLTNDEGSYTTTLMKR